MKTRHVIIGTSAAGIGALTKLRILDPYAEIYCISASVYPPYNTCLLADYVAGGRSTREIYTKPRSYFVENDIQLRLATRLEAIDARNKAVHLSDGSVLEYDTLFLGMGSTARTPSLPDIQKVRGIFSFHTLDDARTLLSYVQHNTIRHAVVIGAGLSGVECSDALANRGIKVSLIEQSDRLLSRQVDKDGSQVIEQAMSRAGVTFYAQESIERIEKIDGTVTAVHLKSGKRIATDMVVFTIGSKPNSSLAEAAGIRLLGKHILTNEYMQTSISDIYAGGDVCVVRDCVSGTLVPNTTWPDAMMQGMMAAHSMAGQPRLYNGLLTVTSSVFFDLTFVSCGPVCSDTFDYQITRNTSDSYHKKILHDGELRGFLMVGDVNEVGLLRKQVMLGAVQR